MRILILGGTLFIGRRIARELLARGDDVMVVQLIYQWPIVSGPFGYVLANIGNGKTEIIGVAAFRVEPY